MSTAPQSSAAPALPTTLVSRLSSDPDMVELIQMFVDEIPDRARLVNEHWQHRNLDELRRIAHQLKGACGGYGFPELGQAAGTLEAGLCKNPSQAHHSDLEAIGRQVNELIDLCSRVRAA